MSSARLTVVAVALLCAVLGVLLAIDSAGEAQLGRARADLLAGRHAQALTELSGLGGEAARRASALRGYAHLGLGQPQKARAALQVAVRRSPNEWVLQRDYAIALLRSGARRKAQARMQRARALNPRMALPAGFVERR